jgi:hypothetical protein
MVQPIKEGTGKIPASPWAEFIIGYLIEAVHEPEKFAGNLLTFEYFQPNSLILQRPALPFNVASLIGIKN